MRASLFLLFSMLFLGVILWITLSGALFWFGFSLYLFLIIITIGYPDTLILFFLGAREVKGRDNQNFHTAAVQEAYKLAVAQPKLYFYNGALERAFILQNRNRISLILSHDLLEICNKDELSAICFELLIQAKKKLAPKRTRVMFIVGLISWFVHSVIGLFLKLIPVASLNHAMNWFIHYLLNPWIEAIFKFTMGEKYFRKLDSLIREYPIESDLLMKVGAKLRAPVEIYSLPSRKMIEFSSINKSRHFQNILTLEFLPHEWDFIFDTKANPRA